MVDSGSCVRRVDVVVMDPNSKIRFHPNGFGRIGNMARSQDSPEALRSDIFFFLVIGTEFLSCILSSHLKHSLDSFIVTHQ